MSDNVTVNIVDEIQDVSIAITESQNVNIDVNEKLPIEMQAGTTYIQYRYISTLEWIDLIAIEDLKGVKGDKGEKGDTGIGVPVGLLEGSVLFSNSTGVISQDNNNLFWDNVNKRFGINNNNPRDSFEVVSGESNDSVSIRAKNSFSNGTSRIFVTDNEGSFEMGVSVNSKYSLDYAFADMGYSGWFGTASVIPVSFIANNDLAWYLSKSSETGFYNNRPRGLFDISNQRYSIGMIYMTDFPQPGDTITITDSFTNVRTFEFQTSGGSVTIPNIKVVIPAEMNTLHENLISAISSSGLYVDTDSPNADNIALKQQKADVIYDIPITKNEVGNVIQISGFIGGQILSGEVDFYFDRSTGDMVQSKGIRIGQGLKLADYTTIGTAEEGMIAWNFATSSLMCYTNANVWEQVNK
jgi:hypothetical protein